jgi:hypothetical protein
MAAFDDEPAYAEDVLRLLKQLNFEPGNPNAAVLLEKIEARVAEMTSLLAGLTAVFAESPPPGAQPPNTVRARQKYADLSLGPCKDEHLVPLREASPLLSVLFNRGFSFSSLTKFSTTEMKWARLLEGTYRLEPVVRMALTQEKPWTGHIGAGAKVAKAFTAFEKIGLVVPFTLKARIEGLEPEALPDWRETVSGKHPKYRPSAIIGCRLETAQEEPEETGEPRKKSPAKATVNEGFLTGHWLTALTYEIVLDQLQRNAAGRYGSVAGVEAYAELEYALPNDLIAGSSDIDVLARSGGDIYYVECKSGGLGLTSAQRNNKAAPPPMAEDDPLGKTVKHVKQFEELFDRLSRPGRLRYLLVFVESERNATADVQSALDRLSGGIPIQAIPFDGLRQALFVGSALPDD